MFAGFDKDKVDDFAKLLMCNHIVSAGYGAEYPLQRRCQQIYITLGGDEIGKMEILLRSVVNGTDDH
jgi:hypothetical protein